MKAKFISFLFILFFVPFVYADEQKFETNYSIVIVPYKVGNETFANITINTEEKTVFVEGHNFSVQFTKVDDIKFNRNTTTNLTINLSRRAIENLEGLCGDNNCSDAYDQCKEEMRDLSNSKTISDERVMFYKSSFENATANESYYRDTIATLNNSVSTTNGNLNTCNTEKTGLVTTNQSLKKNQYTYAIIAIIILGGYIYFKYHAPFKFKDKGRSGVEPSSSQKVDVKVDPNLVFKKN